MTEWSISADSVWHFVYQQQQQHNVTTTSSQHKSDSGVVVKFNYRQCDLCARKHKYPNNHVKVMTRKILASFFVDAVYKPQFIKTTPSLSKCTRNRRNIEKYLITTTSMI